MRNGRKGWCEHAALARFSPDSAAILAQIQAVGARADSSWFADDGLVHLDLHTDNILIENDQVTGIIDWEGACQGDHLYDLVQFAYDLDGHDQPVWQIVEASNIPPRVLRAYVCLLVLKSMSSAIRMRSWDMDRQFALAARVFDRFAI